MIAYDYIVTAIVTDKNGQKEEYAHPVVSYSLQEAMMTTLLELEHEHNLKQRGAVITIKSVRPDIEKIGEQTRSMIEEMRKQIKS